nr:putative porin [uncultured Veillonella sp.]
MKKQFAAIFAATAVLGVTTAFAANPFSDVTPDSWAYQAVSQLAAAGIVNGYPDGTFKGQNNITRYEMAQMVAKAMANQDRANAEQQAMINRLADEFSNELNNLGVRVARLEDRVGNVKVTGDARLRYQDEEKGNSKFDARARVQFNAKVNDRTDAVVRLTSGSFELGNASKTATASVDRAYVNHKFGERVSVKAGRFGQMIGAGLAYDDAFDGVQFNAGNDKVNFQAAYGYGIAGDTLSTRTQNNNPELVVANLNGKVGKHANVGGFYTHVNGEDLQLGGKNVKNIYGFNTDLNFDKVWVGGEWLKASNVAKSQAWTAGIGYGNYNQAKQGTWDIKAQYFNQKENSPILSSTWNQKYGANSKGWLATVDYALQNNVGLSAYYGFDWKTQNGTDQHDFYRADLNYKF